MSLPPHPLRHQELAILNHLLPLLQLHRSQVPHSHQKKTSALSMSLLQSIQTGGSNLKRVTVEERSAKKPESGGGLLGMLATAMSERRTVIIESDDDDDEDSGWSSDDSN
mmetsp:Transcript_1135/g.2311  ORF Transcript_1135/g.2311 Transcript_1135/m.2311 type:complete len:110 (-) Transcript_1135:1646-1975(-)